MFAAVAILVLMCSSAQGWFFSVGGSGELATAIRNPIDAIRVSSIADRTKHDAARLYPSKQSLNDGEGDAFRHALWNHRMTQAIGKSEAKKFGDAHEVGNWWKGTYGKNNPGSKSMDLFNNNVGRNLQPVPGKTDIQVVQDAIAAGKLRTSPGKLRSSD